MTRDELLKEAANELKRRTGYYMDIPQPDIDAMMLENATAIFDIAMADGVSREDATEKALRVLARRADVFGSDIYNGVGRSGEETKRILGNHASVVVDMTMNWKAR